MERDKRAFPRIDFQGRTVVYLGDQQLVCKGSNLSAGGMLLLAPLAAPLGQTLKLVLSLRPSQWINVEARVVRHARESAAFAWGVEFVRVSRELASTLTGFVTENLGLAPLATGQAAPDIGPSRRPEPEAARLGASGGLFSRLKSRISAAWSGGGGEPIPSHEKGTSYAVGRSASAPSPAVAPRPAAQLRDTEAPPIEQDVTPMAEDAPVREIEDVLPHDDVLGDVEKLSGNDRRLHKLYRAALEDIHPNRPSKK